MTTSLADLLWTLDDETDASPGDATAALSHTSRALSRLIFIGKYAEFNSQRVDVVRSLAGACAAVAAAWPGQPGRSAELMGIIADVVGRDQYRLSGADKWQVALSTASVARRWAGVISEAGPAHQAPRLALLISASDEVRRLGASTPPRPVQFDRLKAPISSPAVIATDPAQMCAGTVGRLADLLGRRDRTRLTVRQMIGLCIGAEAVVEAAERLLPEGAGASTPSRMWSEARAALTDLTDGIADPTAGDNGDVLLLAARSRRLISRVVVANLSQTQVTHIQEAVDSLSKVATAVERDLRSMSDRVIVRLGDKPLREERVGEWLGRKAFVAGSEDLDLASTLLLRSQAQTRDLAAELDGKTGQQLSAASSNRNRIARSPRPAANRQAGRELV